MPRLAGREIPSVLVKTRSLAILEMTKQSVPTSELSWLEIICKSVRMTVSQARSFCVRQEVRNMVLIAELLNPWARDEYGDNPDDPSSVSYVYYHKNGRILRRGGEGDKLVDIGPLGTGFHVVDVPSDCVPDGLRHRSLGALDDFLIREQVVTNSSPVAAELSMRVKVHDSAAAELVKAIEEMYITAGVLDEPGGLLDASTES
jgi:hypothetical protein